MFPFTISDKAVTVFVDGRPRSFASSHGSYEAIKTAILAGDEEMVRSLTDVKAHIAKSTFGRVQIFDSEILVDGRQVSGKLVDRILEMVRLGSDAISGYVKFLDNLMDNPRKMAVDELYLFIEACDLPITPDGCFLAYRYVDSSYFDSHSHTVFAKPAIKMTDDEIATYSDGVIGGTRNEVTTQVIDGSTTVSMPRNMVEDNRDITCSDGLHFCSYTYLPSYGSGHRVLVLKINPADVVSIPSDYNNSKGRTWKYVVVDEIENWEDTKISPWYTSEYDDIHEDDDGEYEDDDGDDFEFEVDEETGEIMDTDSHDLEGKHATKLTWDEVRDIRDLLTDGVSLTEVARIFGISRRQAARIRDFECWREESDVPY